MGDAMKCFICERGPSHGISVFRINPKGQKGIWACEVHRPAGSQHTGAEVRKIVQIIEDSGQTKRQASKRNRREEKEMAKIADEYDLNLEAEFHEYLKKKYGGRI